MNNIWIAVLVACSIRGYISLVHCNINGSESYYDSKEECEIKSTRTYHVPSYCIEVKVEKLPSKFRRDIF